MASLPFPEPWPELDCEGAFALIAHREAVIVEASEKWIRAQHMGQLRVGSRVPIAVRMDAQPVSIDARVTSSHLVRIAPAPLYESRLEPRGGGGALQFLCARMSS